MQRTNIYLEDRQTAALDDLARVEGISRAEVIRRLIDRALAGSATSTAAGHAAIDLAFGAAREIERTDRAPGGREAHLAAIWGREA